MTLANIPSGTRVFLDANTLVYAVLAHPTYGAACKTLLDRIEHQDLQGFTSSHIISEMAHRLMTIEACDRFGWPAQGIANRLRRHPAEVRQLAVPRRAIDEINAAHVMGLPVLAEQVSRAADLSQQFGLLSADALLVVVMQDNSLTALASLDSDFDRFPGLTRYSPL
jgi:predicted nucleic acid-binding protein